MLYLGLILAMVCAGVSAFMLTFVRVFRPDGEACCVAEEWERARMLPIKGYRCCNTFRSGGMRRRYRALFRGIARDWRERGEITEIHSLMLREGGVVFQALRYCDRNSHAFSGLETFQGVPLVVWRKLFALSGYEIAVSLDGHDHRLNCRYEAVYEVAALILLADRPVSGSLHAEWWSFCCRRLKELLSKSDRPQSSAPVLSPPYSVAYLVKCFSLAEQEMLAKTHPARQPIAPILPETPRYTIGLSSSDGRQCGTLTHYSFGVLGSDRLELAALSDRLYLSVNEVRVWVRWRVRMLCQTEFELTAQSDAREITLSLLSVGALAIVCRGRIPVTIRRALMELSVLLRRRRVFCHLKIQGNRAYLFVGMRRDRQVNLSRVLDLTDGFRIAARLAGGRVPERFGGLLETIRLPSEFRMEQFWYALQGDLPQIHKGNLFDSANYLMLSCDSRCTERLLNEIATLYARLRCYYPNTCLLVTGRSLSEARDKLGFLRCGRWGDGLIFTLSSNPNRRTLEKHALLCAKNGKLETIKRDRGNFMRQDAVNGRKIESSLDELLGIDKLFEDFYAEPDSGGGYRDVISDVLDGFMNLQIPYKLHLRNRFVEWFSLQSIDGRICSRYSPTSLTEGNPYTTLMPIVLVMFYVRIFHDDAILQTQLAYRADAEAFREVYSESLFDVGSPAVRGVARRQSSPISDTLLFHIINGLSYCIESRYEGKEDGIYRYFLNGCLRFFSKKIPNMSVRERLLSGVRYCLPPLSGTLCDFILHEVFLKKDLRRALENFDEACIRLREQKGLRRKVAVALLIQFYYRRVLQISYRGKMVSVKPQLWLRDSYDVRIDGFTCKVTRGKNGIILGNIFYSNINYVSLDTKQPVTILTEGDGESF